MTNKRTFYLYKPLNSLEHFSQLQNYMKQKLWFTKLSEFNDPFEGHFQYNQLTPLNNQEFFDKCCKGLHLTEEQLRDAITSPEAKDLLKDRVLNDDLFKNHGTVCLTMSQSNIPMWVHYANNHQGYCLIIEIDIDEISEMIVYGKGDVRLNINEINSYVNSIFDENVHDSERGILYFNNTKDDDKHFIFTKVKYQDELPIIDAKILENTINYSEYDKAKYMIQNSVGVKFSQWSYENEFRLISNCNGKENGLMDLNGYPFIKITGIILGVKIGKGLNKDALDFIKTLALTGFEFKKKNIEEQVKEYIVYLAKKHNVEPKTAELSKENYEIEIKKYVDTSIVASSNESLELPETVI